MFIHVRQRIGILLLLLGENCIQISFLDLKEHKKQTRAKAQQADIKEKEQLRLTSPLSAPKRGTKKKLSLAAGDCSLHSSFKKGKKRKS